MAAVKPDRAVDEISGAERSKRKMAKSIYQRSCREQDIESDWPRVGFYHVPAGSSADRRVVAVASYCRHICTEFQ